MILWETLAICGLLAALLFGAKSVRDYLLSRRLASNVRELQTENAAFRTNVDALVAENAALVQLKTDLAAELQEFQRDLEALKGVCATVGDLSDDALQKMTDIYHRHRSLLRAEVKASALRVRMAICPELERPLGKEPWPTAGRTAVVRRMAVLFPLRAAQLPHMVSDAVLADPASLQELIEGLLTDSLKDK